MSASSFEALSDAQKNEVLAGIESVTPAQRLAESRPLSPRERADWRAFKAEAIKRRKGRPTIGKGSRVISVSVEKGFLREADAYARRHGLGRSEMVIRALGGLLAAERARQ